MIHNISKFIAALALLATAQGTWADTETVSYVDADGNAQTPVEANLITSSNDLTLLYSGWYVVKENTTCSSVRLMTQETTNIILCDGATLSVTSLDGNNTDQSLVVWGQTQGTGTLDFEEIRGDIVTSVTVNSGKLICSSVTDGNSYAIGGKNCTLTVNGGEVRLASGLFGSVMGNVVFNGGVLDCAKVKGNVTLNNSRSTDHVKISQFGGTVTVALPDGYAYTDGSGNYYANGTLTDAQKSAIAGKTLNVAPDPAHFSQSGDEYTIHTATGWGVFCDCLNDNDTYNRFSGKTVRLDADITVTRMAGSDYHDFCGTFDGGGNTITLDGNTTNGCYALFRNVSTGRANPDDEADTPSAIRNLHVDGTITTASKYAAGLISGMWGTVNISNCISSVTIRSSVSGDGTHGGFVAASNGTANISGCLFDGKLLSTGTNATTHCAGFVGYGTTNITNCLYAPADLADGETEITDGSATFCRNGATVTNCYYTRALGTAQGKATRTVAPAADVTIDAVTLTGTATQYNVSGITAYSGGGLQRGQTLYYGSGDQLSLTLSNTAPAASLGYQYAYTASAGTLSGSTLTMPDQDVTISTALAPIDWATVNQGTIGEPYMIYNKDQLLLLAHRVNGTNGETSNGYQGKYFKLGADITFSHPANEGDNYAENYEAIGTYNGGFYSNFKGNFDGDGHTVSGIRIRKTGSGDANSYQGLFGFIDSSADIHDVHLTDARITGYERVGGIAGLNYGTVSGCSVTDSYITANSNWLYGTICGENHGTLTNNYYHGCTVDDTANATGVGCDGSDIADNNGALPAYAIALGANITTPPGNLRQPDRMAHHPPC